MALAIGYVARFCLALVLLAAGLFVVVSGYYLDNLMLVVVGWFVSLTGSAVATFNEMRRLTEGIPGTK